MRNGKLRLAALNKPEISIGIDVTQEARRTDENFWVFGGRRDEAITHTTVRELK